MRLSEKACRFIKGGARKRVPLSGDFEAFMGLSKSERRVMDGLKVPEWYFTDEAYLRYAERADWRCVSPIVQDFAALFVEYWRKQNIPLYVHTALRDHDTQADLVRRGLSQTPPPRAPHVLGAAVDIVHARLHWDMSEEQWRILGRVGQDICRKRDLPLVWGGDWDNDGFPVGQDPDERFWDPAHWQVEHWREMPTPIVDGPPLRRSPRKLLAVRGLRRNA